MIDLAKVLSGQSCAKLFNNALYECLMHATKKHKNAEESNPFSYVFCDFGAFLWLGGNYGCAGKTIVERIAFATHKCKEDPDTGRQGHEVEDGSTDRLPAGRD